MNEKYNALFTPWKIGNVEMKNRIVQCSMGGTSLFGWMEPNHFDKEAAYFLLNRAQDGVGLILPGMQCIRDPLGIPGRKWLYQNDQMFKQLKEYMVEFHKTGAKLFIQLAAGMGRSMAINGWMTMLAKNNFLNKIVSPIVDVQYICASASEVPNRWKEDVMSRPLTVKEIQDMVHAFGKTAKKLRAAGVAVEKDFLRRECDALNPVFFHYITARTPYVALKYAMTADGKLAARTGRSQWITGETARAHVHSLRSRYRAILVGVGTILADDPLLNCRMEGGRDPLRVVLDSRLRTPLSARVCRTAQTQKTIFVCAVENAQKRAQLQALGAEVLCLGGADGRVDWVALMRELGAREIDSVLIEGGAEIQYSALCAGVVQRLYVYVGAMLLGGAGAKSPVGGLGAPDPAEAFALSAPEIELFGRDVLLSYDVLAREKEAF